ncbi:uncharacterized protein BP5553_10159 [Venustampulla echinocandica]|uniref:Carrier domain-containing protein n=1 Tax=Venustampulla echinocandica TaxID=2656787 RepID=A0A370TAG9_9HELO|nr:uncharacterized protein BP5553_10159 [Venustampulla echinocandica]RDL30814.1 hypothetical protein BP5553_10159 [Venustampulla echinocandica]
MAETLSILNDPPKLLEGPQLLHHLIQWEKYSSNCAIDFTSNDRRRQYTYHEIQSSVASLVLEIQESLTTARDENRERKESPQHIVPVLVPQSPGLYISQLSILNSGGAFCPINLDAPKERIKFVVGDVEAQIIITTSEFKEAVSWENGPSIILIDEFPEVPEVLPQWKSPETPPEHLAYVMYTSGSSGKPKGVAVSHLAVSQSLLSHQRHIPQFQRFLQFAAPSFDVSVFEIFFPLVRGSTLVGCNRTQLLNDLPGTITKLEVDACELTPTVAGSLLQKRAHAPGLKLLLTIGEMLTWPIVEEFGGSETQETMLYGMYGPTEAAIHCTVYPAMAANTKPGNIGIPFDAVSTFIAAESTPEDEPDTMKILPLGELGELVLGGPQLARGYLNRPDQNKLAFVHADGKNLYRTGDKARQLKDGTIEIHGRMSAGQVKLRGQRVELGEIEEAVYRHPGVKTVVAMVLSGALVVFALVGAGNSNPDQVLKTCAKWLPKFMVPSEIVLLQAFPYLTSGKVDKRQLEADYKQRRETEATDIPDSATPTERVVGESLRQLLGPFPANMRLTAAGLDSLMAIRVSSKLRSSGFNISTVAILQVDTHASLVQLCEESTSMETGKTSPNVELATSDLTAVLNGNTFDVESTMPCTPLQSAMLSETAVDPRAYQNWVELELSGVTDLKQVRSVLHTLAEKNSILRTGFAESPVSSGFVQIIWKGLEDSQIEFVENLLYDLEVSDYVSLHRPVKVQALQAGQNTRLLIHIHHALYDGWSLELLLDDLDAMLMGMPTPSRPPFSDVVHGYMDGTLETDNWESKEYWKDHLANLSPRKMPNFHSRKHQSTGLAVARLATSIPTSEIEAAARYLNSSSQSIFQAAYSLVLSSYLGSSDICFGTVLSGRTLPIPGIEDIAGPCLATMPVRIDLSVSQSIQELAQDLNLTNRKHLEHSLIPLRDIKSACGINSRQPLFDTLLIWQQTLHAYDHTRDCVRLVDTADNLEFNLTLEVIPGTGNVELKANYQKAIFPESQINLLLQQIEALAKLVIGDQAQPITGVFDAMDDELLSVENPYPKKVVNDETLSSPVERMATTDPSRPAITFAKSIDSDKVDTSSISYSKLNELSNQMGHHLLSLNVLPDDLICICMEKSIELYASILATSKAGAGYLPLTPDVPDERLQYILREANVKVVMAQSSSRPLLKSLRDIAVVYVDEVDFSAQSTENILLVSSPENLSYCVFTSGSTGTPKGVLVTQGNLLSNLTALEEIYPATADSRFLQSCSQAFDVSVFEIFFTWRVGGCICSATKDVIFQDIENAIRVLNVTHLSMTPTVAALVNPDNVRQVQFLVTAGEAVTELVFKTWVDKGLYIGYGPSETTNICTINPQATQDDTTTNLGPPLTNTSAFVLSPGQGVSFVPRGGEGELCFGGSQVFRGYMDPNQTVGKIIEHPKFGRLYRSGDFGRLMPNGSLEFTGRKDDQVKIRGQRVELGEINNVVSRSEGVQDCVTIVIEGKENSSQLVCFWTPESERSASFSCLQPDPLVISALFKQLEAALLAYMIPSALVPVSYLPSTPQGKIDKRRLIREFEALDIKYLERASQVSRSASDHQWTDLELDIAKTLAQVTNVAVDQIGPDTSFFTLGIDSISAISFARILRASTKHRVGISELLKYSSVVRLAERMVSHEKIDKVETSRPEEKDFGFGQKFLDATIESFAQAGRRVKTILPCTPLQEAMLSAGESSSESLYSNTVTLQVHGDLEIIRNCWKEMVRRHEILRACFVSTDIPRYAYAQVILENYDLEFGSIEEGQEPAQLIQADEAPAGLNKFQPPYSIDVATSGNSTKLLISMHHALYDGEALAILYEEVERLYHHEPLPPPVSFAPFLHSVTGIQVTEYEQFWGSVLKDYSPTGVKGRFAVQEAQPTKDHTQIQRISTQCSLSWIEDNIKKCGTSLLAVCQTVWATILSEKLQNKDICFGNVVSGRTVPIEGIERLVAPCFNTIPARLRDTHSLSYLEAFRKLQSLNADSIPFQLTPLRRLQSKFSPDGTRLFDALFLLQQPSKALDSSIWSISDDSGAMDFPLVCEVVPDRGDDTLEIILHYYTSIISPNEALELLKSFDEKIQISLDNPRHQLLSSTVKDQVIESSISREFSKSDATKQSSLSTEMTSEEKIMRDIISDFTDMPIERIGRDVSIFRLGLDSISTVQVATRLRKLGYRVMASDILENPTITQLAAHLKSHSDSPSQDVRFDFEAFDKVHREAISRSIEIPLAQIEAVRPCTAVQQGMIAQSLHSNGQEYVNSLCMELLPSLPIATLKSAWAEACKEHEMLRTFFVPSDDSQHPFVTALYAKEWFSLPFYEGLHEDEIPNQDLQRPWSLALLENIGKVTVKLTAHHALYDAQSIYMILEDVAKACVSNPITSRPPITSLLGAILEESGKDVEAKKLFWQQEENRIIVNKFPDLTPLQNPSATSAVREIESQISAGEHEESCREHGVTMQAAGQVAWARLLAAYIGEPSTTFGITLSGRSIHEEANHIAFPSIVTLPIRCDINGTNADLLSRAMNFNAQLHRHQFTPLTSIQKWNGLLEGKTFDTLFAYQKMPSFDNEITAPWNIAHEEASVDYVVSMEIQPVKSGALALRLTFREDLVPAEHAEIILRQYDSLLIDTLRNPHSVSDVAPDLGTALLSITPAEEPELPDSAQLLHHFVERGAQQWPSKTAFEFATRLEPGNVQTRFWTYSELDKEGNKIAHMLNQRGIIAGEIIATCFDKCPEASFAIIGILKAGCAYVALDPNAPGDRLKFIIEDSGAKLILSAGKTGHTLERDLDSNVIMLDSRAIYADCTSDTVKLTRDISPQDVSYCLYTSGTTGTPKGCLITHENAVQAMLSFQRLFAGHWTEESKWLQFASFHFDVSVLEQFWSWSVGICVASAPRDLIFEDIPGAIQGLGITHIDLTPSLARLLHPKDVPSLCNGVFITGGEQLRQEILDVWGEIGCIYNGYGPTEATIGVTMYPRVPRNGKPSNIGPQFDNVGSYVLKPGSTLPVLRGGVGELCVSGKLVGKGYLNRPDLTTERFPVLDNFGERVYRTGDLVRILHDGSFLFLGRADDQVKLRGQRLELSEINEVIKKGVNNLQDVVTLVLKHQAQQKEQLVTFFVAEVDSSSADPASLIPAMKEACKSRLPGYMVPTHFIPIKALPLSANNKADSKQLAAIYNQLDTEEIQKLSHSTQRDADWSENEKIILTTIAKTLRVEIPALSRDSNIFELGLDSISIIGFSRALQTAGLENAKLSVVKSNPAMGGLVAALSNGNGTSYQENENAYVATKQRIAAFEQKYMVGICRELSVEAADVECISPCTPVQEGMVYRFLESEVPLYFNQFDFKLTGGIDTEKLLAAWSRVVSQSQILRTKFVVTDDGYAQIVLKWLDISWANSSVDYAKLDKSLALRTPFNLALEATSSGNIMRFQVFHGLYDGNSLTLLLQHVVGEYNQTEHVEYGPSFHSSLPYGPLARVKGAQEFWKEHLQEWRDHTIPTQSEARDDIVENSTRINLAGLEDFRKTLGVTPQAVFQAAWLSVLQEILSPILTIGIVTSGRAIDFDDAEKINGPLFNTVPFHVNIESKMSFAALVSKCHEFNMRMQDFQHTPLNDIQKWSPAGAGQALFETLFVFQRSQVGEEDYARGLWLEVDGEQFADYPVAFEAVLGPDNNQLDMTIVAQGSVLTQSDAKALLGKMEKAIQDIIESKGQIPILPHEHIENGLPILPNGSVSDPLSSTPCQEQPIDNPFEWTEETKAVRSEIALLAEVPEDSVRETSSIFELGLDSIDVIKLSSRLKKRNIEILVSAIIKCQTISKLAPYASIGGNQDQDTSSGKLVQNISTALTKHLQTTGKLPAGTEQVLPATPLQESMVNEMLKSDYERYFNIDALKLHENIDPGRLMAAAKSAVENSPIFTSTFIEIEDPQLPISYALAILSPTEKKLLTSTIILPQDQSFQNFMKDLKVDCVRRAKAQNALFQMYLIDAGSAHYLVMAAAHALYDGTSMQALHEDIAMAYNGQFSQRPDFTPFLEQVVQSTTEDAKKFWRATLSNLPSAEFPKMELLEGTDTAMHRQQQQSHISIKDIETLCKSSRVTLQTLGQTCWALVLAHLTGQLDVVFGSVLSCRDTEEASEVMFPLMNTVAVRSVLHGNLVELLAHMQNLSDTTRQYQHFPLGTAQAYALASRLHRSPTATTTLFDTLFIYQGRRQTPSTRPLYDSVYGDSSVEFPVCVEMEIVDNNLIWTTACKSIARNEDETSGLLDALDSVLQRMINDPQSPTIESDGSGISVCGLPKFTKAQPKRQVSTPRVTDVVSSKWSTTELQIRQALHELSNVPEDMIQKDSTIFHLGLDSILILKLPALLKKYGIKLNVSDILREQTIYSMSQLILNANPTIQQPVGFDAVISNAISKINLTSELKDLEKSIGDIQDVMPVTAGQLYMIRQWQVSCGTLFYPTFTYATTSPLDRARVDTAWKKLLRRHDILRTGFVEVGSAILQITYKNPANEVVYGDKKLPNSDLGSPPASLTVKEGTDGNVNFKFRIHHALYDGVSLPILMDEFESLYHGRETNTLRGDFKPFVAQSIQSASSAATQEKWTSYLRQQTPEPSKSINPPSGINPNKRTEVFRPSHLVPPLKQRAQDSGVSIDALLLASIAKQYAHYLHTISSMQSTPNIVFGIYHANRAPFGEDLSDLPVPTLNILPLRVHSPLTNNIAELAKEIQADLSKLSSADMVCASLKDIYKWTGARVDFVVNILKSSAFTDVPTSRAESSRFELLQDLPSKAEVVGYPLNGNMASPQLENGIFDGYPPTIDVEIRYQEEKIDVGVFAPSDMLSVNAAEGMIQKFIEEF